MEDIVSSILIGLILFMTEKGNNIEQAKLWGFDTNLEYLYLRSLDLKKIHLEEKPVSMTFAGDSPIGKTNMSTRLTGSDPRFAADIGVFAGM